MVQIFVLKVLQFGLIPAGQVDNSNFRLF